MTIGWILEKLSEHLSKVYSEDTCRPGVLVSYLDSEKVWYASIHRYPRGPWKRRKVVAYTKNKSLKACLKELTKKVTP